MADCLFCRICSGEARATRVHEDDINPAAPTHLLVLPRKHIATLHDLTEADDALMGQLYRLASKIALAEGHRDFRVVVNCGAGVGQSVFHVHVHVLAGRGLGWPPG
jgi:histidine triad (HIT) family protein